MFCIMIIEDGNNQLEDSSHCTYPGVDISEKRAQKLLLSLHSTSIHLVHLHGIKVSKDVDKLDTIYMYHRSVGS